MTSERSHDSLPRHVAIVMDGNGRWARKRFMPRGMGHRAGVDALVKVVQATAARGIPYLTVFAFSSENWKRPEEEVSGLMSLLLVALSKHLARLSADGVRVRVIGDLDSVSERIHHALREAEQATAHNSRLTLTVAFNYGGRWDIVQACRRAMRAGVAPEALDEATLSRHMAMADTPDPDLFIRTGGEVRLSNFLLWQSAYAELYFTDCLWPDFDDGELDRALRDYAGRERRFGDVGASGQGDAAVGLGESPVEQGDR
ncbi:di-trans,poly-cis-decaprenylcistransferase [Aquabacterium fontiphilum]|jgi:undecaprenyl diphosphate synthase|uniref:polyprenyl diphosphate synthase n=1 Tax=Aquabacterium fontiphilum TaxID=450365 RepID=UPI0013784A88|nr:polyprenyl diphosphate synthase [Aquabacterium fontiphilum]NBD21498.1 di-trans,poly-cis-decaprenylcistransferase [Aquabacterium fontiphilum]